MSARPRPFAWRAASVALLAAVALVACGSDDSGANDTLPPVATTTTEPVVTAPPITVAPATSAPATSAPVTLPSTSTTSTIASSTTSSTTPTTTPPKGAALILRKDGLGDASFGADADEVIAYVRSILGAPTADSGWADPFASFGICPGTEVRGVSWGDLQLLFSDSSVVTSGRRHFFTYSYGKAFGPTIDPPGLHTEDGIGVGSTVAELRAAFPGVVINPSDDIFDANFYVSDDFTGLLSGPADTDTVESFVGGISCGE